MWRVWAINPTHNPSPTLHAPSQKSVPFYGALLSCGNYSGRLLLARDTIRRAQTASFHTYLAPSQTGYFGHQTTCVVTIPRMCKTRLLTFPKCCDMLTRFGFRGKIYYLCTSEEERALNTGLSPLFLVNIRREIHRKLEILDALSEIFLALSEIFLALSVNELPM